MAADTLAGIKVIEFGQNLAGPYAGQILAFLGAEVVKIERPEGDDARGWGPPFIDDDAVGFIALNRGKQSIVIDLTKPADKARLVDLIGDADVFLHNLRPDVPAKFGIDGDSMTKRFPRLVYADLSAFGHTGPWATRPGYEPIIQATAGLISINGDPNGPPARIGVSIIDLSTGMWTAIGILAALQRRERTGQGGIVQTSLFETGLMWLSNHIAGFTNSGKVSPRQGTGHPNLAPYQAFQCANGLLMVTPGNQRLWAKFAEVLGHPEWPADPRFTTNIERMRHRDLLIGMIEEIMRRDTKEAWAERLMAAGVPCGPINEVPEVIAQAQVAALAMLVAPYAGNPTLFHGLPISFEGNRAGDERPAPKVGQDS